MRALRKVNVILIMAIGDATVTSIFQLSRHETTHGYARASIGGARGGGGGGGALAFQSDSK